MTDLNLESFKQRVFKCEKCSRLTKFRKLISQKKRKSYFKQKYWGKPIVGYGKLNAQILFIGLAPAAHGATRTGRVFTGDKSADFLFKCLHKANLCNHPYSLNKEDGLILYNTYITTALKCVPPEDKPTAQELNNCFSIFDRELMFLKNKKVLIALGKVAFDACIKYFINYYNLKTKYKFKHNAVFKIGNFYLVGCYHPSPRNVNTKRINQLKMVRLFLKAQKLMKHNLSK